MVRGKQENISNRSQCDLAGSEHTSSTTASSGYSDTSEKQDSDLKSHLLKMMEAFKENINSSLKKYRRKGHQQWNQGDTGTS